MHGDTTLIANPLIWLMPEIERSLTLARAALGLSLGSIDAREAELAACETHLQQVRGALAIVSLTGAARYCSALEDAVAHCAVERATHTRLNVSIIDRAIFALSQYLDDMVQGEPDVPLKLFPVYRELYELSGRAEVSEIELFFPDLTPLPPGDPTELNVQDLRAHRIACRAQFQRGLLAWLKGTAAFEGLQSMRSSLDALGHVANDTDLPPGFWWSAAGLIDLAMHPDDRVGTAPLKLLFGRIERLMRDLISGGSADTHEVMREVLYWLALGAPVSRRVREIKNLYRLDAQLPEFCVSGTLEYDVAALSPVLDEMRRQLTAIEDAWSRYTAGSGEDLLSLRDQVSNLKTIARDLGHYRLLRLLDIVSLISSKLPDPYPRANELLALEMASALLFMEGMLDHFTSPPADIDQQVAVMVGWLLDAVKPRGNAAIVSGSARDDITQRQQFSQIRARVAHEILENLRVIEHTIDQIARAPGAGASMASLDTLVRQIAGALKMLGLSRAHGVLSACLHLMKLSESEDAGLKRASLAWVADGMSCLGFYLEALERGENPTEAILFGFLQRLGENDARPAGSTGWIPAAGDEDRFDEDGVAFDAEFDDAPLNLDSSAREEVIAALPVDAPPPDAGPTDEIDELRQVYLQEAHELLGALSEPIGQLRDVPTDRVALARVRRDFHTLKGSASLVGLLELGTLALEIERTLNRWLQLEHPATPALTQLLADTTDRFGTALARIESGTPLEPDVFGDIVERAVQLCAELPTNTSPDTTQRLAPGADREANARIEVEIGSVRISEMLYQIYLRESAAHLGTIASQLEMIENSGAATIADPLIRAAHTLKSSSRTAGFEPVANLAEALEDCLHRLAGTTPNDAARAVITTVCARLTAMQLDIRERRPPPAAHEEETRLAQIQAYPEDAATNAIVIETPAEPVEDAARLDHAVAMSDELDRELLPVFLDEAGQLLPRIGDDLKLWREQPDDIQPARAIARALHTLKGSARMAGAMHIGECTHAIESRVGMAVESGQCDHHWFEEIERSLDDIADRIDALAIEQRCPESGGAAPGGEDLPPPPAVPPGNGLGTTVRVETDVLDRLVNDAGEINIARSRIEGEMAGLKQSLNELTDSIARLRSQLRETQIQADSQMQSRIDDGRRDERDFDPLEMDRYTRLQELTRMMAETLHDMQMIQHTLFTASTETETALAHQSRIARELQRDLAELRSVPFNTLAERLQRTVRQTGRQLDKEVELRIEGGQTEIDRGVLQRIGAPLEHMLRNAIAHGIESGAQRLAQGKPAHGTIVLDVARDGTENVISLTDDGAGLDAERIRAAATRLGLITTGEADSDDALYRLIFTPGFSTAQAVTETAGRGIGLDVVRAEVAAMGGHIEVQSVPRQGTAFRIRVPMTLTASQVLLVRAGATYALPAAMVEHVLETDAETLAAAYHAGTIRHAGRDYVLHYLPRLLGEADPRAEIRRHNTLVLIGSAAHRLALHVDEVTRNQDVMLKPIGAQLARVPGIVGGTVLGNGQIVLIVNPLQILAGGHLPAILARSPQQRVIATTATVARILVVDDSLTVRRLTSRLLMREGYRVMTAKDGLDALQQMHEALPDLVLLDIEMPRMDGFELGKQLRAAARTATLPIIAVTSRIGDKHQRIALEMGINAFFGKPYPEAELLACVADLLAGKHTAQAA